MWSSLESRTCLNPRTQRPTSSRPRGRAREPGRSRGRRTRMSERIFLFDRLEIPAHEGRNVLDGNWASRCILEVALGLGVHSREE